MNRAHIALPPIIERRLAASANDECRLTAAIVTHTDGASNKMQARAKKNRKADRGGDPEQQQ